MWNFLSASVLYTVPVYLYSGLIFGGGGLIYWGGTYIWNGLNISDVLIDGGAYFPGGGL